MKYTNDFNECSNLYTSTCVHFLKWFKWESWMLCSTAALILVHPYFIFSFILSVFLHLFNRCPQRMWDSGTILATHLNLCSLHSCLGISWLVIGSQKSQSEGRGPTMLESKLPELCQGKLGRGKSASYLYVSQSWTFHVCLNFCRNLNTVDWLIGL